MSLSPEQMDRMMSEHFGYEASDNIAGVLSTLSADAVHDIVGWPTGPTHGREAARPFYEQLFADLAEGRVTTVKRLYGHNFLIDESIWEGKAPGRPFGLEGGNRDLKFRLLHVLEFTESGMISREQVWMDVFAILAQLSAK